MTNPNDFDQYQIATRKTAVYPRIAVDDPDGLGYVHVGFVYPALGLAGEAGEVLEVVKKIVRDDGGEVTPEKRERIKKELGDVLWYLACVADEFQLSFAEVANANLEKLADRKARGVLHGSGDGR